MTVCIAAISGETVVLAADKMATFPGTFSFEGHNRKIMPVGSDSSGFVLAHAGDVGKGREMYEAIQVNSGIGKSVASMAELIAGHYADMRMRLIDAEYFRIRGISLADFYTKGIQNAMNQSTVNGLDSAVTNYNLGVEWLLAGVDASGPQLYLIGNPGTRPVYITPVGFAAIGAWQPSLNSLIMRGQSSTTDLPSTLFNVYAAKRGTEHAQGVGLDTDICIITRSSVRYLTDDEIKVLQELYEDWKDIGGQKIREGLAALLPGASATA